MIGRPAAARGGSNRPGTYTADVFICYSRRDGEWKDHVVRFMNVMKNADCFHYESWDDGEIRPGEDWEKKIETALDQVKVALLLVSADFLQSAFILKREVPKLLERREKEDLIIIPLLVRPCPWEVFDWLRPIQLGNKTDAILSGCSRHEMEEILTDLVREIGRNIANAKSESEAEAEAEAPESKAEGEEIKRLAVVEIPDRKAPLVGPSGFLTDAGIADLIETSPRNPAHRTVVGMILLFRTRTQRTWFAATSTNLFCVLDDAKTAAGGRRIQWTMPLVAANPVRVRERPTKQTGLVDVGRRPNWLYSKRLHKKPEVLRQRIVEMLEAGKRA